MADLFEVFLVDWLSHGFAVAGDCMVVTIFAIRDEVFLNYCDPCECSSIT